MSVVDAPYAAVSPYSTRLSAGSFVVQVMTTEELVTEELWIRLMTGGVVSVAAAVVKLKMPETARLPAKSLDLMR